MATTMRNQIEVTTCVRDNGMHEVGLIDKPDAWADLDEADLDTASRIIVAHARGDLDDVTLAYFTGGPHSTVTHDEATAMSATLAEQCGRLTELRVWLAENRYRLTAEQLEEWRSAESDGMFGRNPFDGEWMQAVADLTALRDRWAE